MTSLDRLEPYDLAELKGQIISHEHAGEFLGWIEEHEDALDWAANLVREKMEQGRVPVGPGYLIERLRYDFPGDLGDGVPKINQSWAPLLARLVMVEHSDLNGAVRINALPEDLDEQPSPVSRATRSALRHLRQKLEEQERQGQLDDTRNEPPGEPRA